MAVVASLDGSGDICHLKLRCPLPVLSFKYEPLVQCHVTCLLSEFWFSCWSGYAAMGSQQQRIMVALGATTGALAACVLAHKLWMRHQDGESLQVLSSSGSWIHQLVLQSSWSLPSVSSDQPQQEQLTPLPVVYDYAQSVEELLVEAHLPAHIQQQDVQVKFGPSSLLVVVGQQHVIDGCLAGRILPQHCSWTIEGQGKARKLSITLVKQPAAAGQQRYVMWDSLLLATEDAPKSPERRDQAAKSG